MALQYKLYFNTVCFDFSKENNLPLYILKKKAPFTEKVNGKLTMIS